MHNCCTLLAWGRARGKEIGGGEHSEDPCRRCREEQRLSYSFSTISKQLKLEFLQPPHHFSTTVYKCIRMCSRLLLNSSNGHNNSMFWKEWSCPTMDRWGIKNSVFLRIVLGKNNRGSMKALLSFLDGVSIQVGVHTGGKGGEKSLVCCFCSLYEKSLLFCYVI